MISAWNFARVVSVYAVAVQLRVVILFALLEFVGMASMQRRAFGFAEVVYSPGLHVFFTMTPARWQGQGNVLLGFLAIGFAVALYAVGAGLLAGIIHFVQNRRGVPKHVAE